MGTKIFSGQDLSGWLCMNTSRKHQPPQAGVAGRGGGGGGQMENVDGKKHDPDMISSVRPGGNKSLFVSNERI